MALGVANDHIFYKMWEFHSLIVPINNGGYSGKLFIFFILILSINLVVYILLLGKLPYLTLHCPNNKPYPLTKTKAFKREVGMS